MSTELPDTLTHLSKQDALVTLYHAWVQLFGSEPKKESIYVLGAQGALEDGWWEKMHCYNFGNVKSVDGDGHDYCFFGCGEELPLSVAQHAVHDSPLVTVKRTYGSGTQQMVSVWIEPKHPWCRFRAFSTALEGATDYISLLNKRFSKSWPAVLAGDPAQFVHLLKLQGYFTADESSYRNTLVSVFGTISRLNVDFTTAPQPDLTDDQKSRIQNLVALTMVQSLDDILSAPNQDDSNSTVA